MRVAEVRAKAWSGVPPFGLENAYCAGLGLPFVLTGLAFRRALRFFAVVRRHQVVVTRSGGLMLVVVGSFLATGAWDAMTSSLRAWSASFGVVL